MGGAGPGGGGDAGRADPDLFGPDRIHPNASGHQLMAAACADLLLEQAYGRPPEPAASY